MLTAVFVVTDNEDGKQPSVTASSVCVCVCVCVCMCACVGIHCIWSQFKTAVTKLHCEDFSKTYECYVHRETEIVCF